MPQTTRSFYGRKVAVRDYGSDSDPSWTPSGGRNRGGGKPPVSKRGRKTKQAEVFVISSSSEEEEEEQVRRGLYSLLLYPSSIPLMPTT